MMAVIFKYKDTLILKKCLVLIISLVVFFLETGKDALPKATRLPFQPASFMVGCSSFMP